MVHGSFGKVQASIRMVHTNADCLEITNWSAWMWSWSVDMDVVSIVVYGCGCLWSIPIWSDDPQSTFIYLHVLLIIHVSSFFPQNLCQGSMPPSVVYTWFTTNNGPKSWVDPGLTIPAAQYCPRRGPGAHDWTSQGLRSRRWGRARQYCGQGHSMMLKGDVTRKGPGKTRKNHIVAWSNHIIKYHGFILLLFVLKKLTCLFFDLQQLGESICEECLVVQFYKVIFYPWLYPSYSIIIHLSFHMLGIEAKPTELPGVKTGFHFHSVPWQWMLKVPEHFSLANKSKEQGI